MAFRERHPCLLKEDPLDDSLSRRGAVLPRPLIIALHHRVVREVHMGGVDHILPTPRLVRRATGIVHARNVRLHVLLLITRSSIA